MLLDLTKLIGVCWPSLVVFKRLAQIKDRTEIKALMLGDVLALEPWQVFLLDRVRWSIRRSNTALSVNHVLVGQQVPALDCRVETACKHLLVYNVRCIEVRVEPLSIRHQTEVRNGVLVGFRNSAHVGEHLLLLLTLQLRAQSLGVAGLP